ncbi:ATP-binding cassette domain-containing protein [Nonomuraea rubra]|uniref:ABC-type transport system involved in cytochrome bd biosynthesis fused ATPase/permease subunit n=1 Tax=Nonomuraea rubra TaxID=46180 RepID=A0A7X0NZE7_9ACTN|nr:ATP-binding cassette domain-containing protein [Nonomuraea rubra]MBB6552458.1 ABC-type transport system involved in cytochrome bd biosynthesis fused ATPase/permease subunit [Nonomuraea rubra]
MRLLPLAGARRVAPFAVLVTGAAVLGPLGTVPLGLLASGGGLVAPAALLLAALLAQELCTALREPAGAAVARGIDGVLRARVRAATVAMPLERLESPLVQADVRLALHGHRGRTAGAAAVAAAGEAGRLASAVLGAAVLSAHVWWLGGAALVLALAQNRRIETMLVGPGGVESLADSAGQARRRRRADYLAGVAGGPGGVAKEIRVFGLESFFVARYVAAMRAYLAPQARGRRAVVRGYGWVLGVQAAAACGTFAVLGRQAGAGWLEAGALAQCVVAALLVFAYGAGGHQMFDVAYGTEPFRAVTRLLAPVPAPPPAGHGGIDLTGVTFAYPHAAAPVLDRLDLRVRPGERLAVVGRNGAGKTTLVKLLTGLYTPRLGTATTCPAAVVFQDFVRYPLSLRDNVRLGDPSFEGTDADVLAALESAGALDLLNFLPGGLGTPLSRAFTGGRDLSGGQWQKVALARAVYAMNADPSRALIVDEPTAHLDARAEREVFERLLDGTGGRTMVLISHRFATVRRADRIVVLEGGAITEQGGHAELMAAGGRYAHWYRLQADLITRDGR